MPSRAAIRFGLIVVCIGNLIGPLDSSVNVAFPAITAAFDIAITDIQWIVISYIIAQSSLTIAFGKIGDLFGHRRVFRWGMLACAMAHLACGFAPTYEALVGWRAAQGIAVGLAMACGPALATLLFPPEQKRQMLSIYLILTGVGGALGPIVGGWIIEITGWPGVFWFRVPIAAIALLLSIGLPEPVVVRTARPKFDIAGALLLTIALTCLILFMSMARRSDVALWIGFALLAGAVGTALAFVRHEGRIEQPILDMRHFSDRFFSGMQMASIAIYLCCFSILLLLPYLLAAQPDYTTQSMGLTLAVFPVGSILASLASGGILQRISSLTLMRYGLIVAAAGLLLLAYACYAPSLVAIGLTMLVSGSGMGIFQVGYADATTSALPVADRGVAGSLVSVTRLIGFVVGAAGITWLFEFLRGTDASPVGIQRTFAALGLTLLTFGVLFWQLRPSRSVER
jgi:EmrB/QacA subfamily drug resistance transporter